MPYIPNWIHPADPAGMTMRGTEIGLAQNAQQMRQEEAARRAQEFAMQQELQRTRMQMMSDEARQRSELEEKYFTQQAKAAADKAAAVMQYQQAIRDGEDPQRALLEFGPAMGSQGAAEAAALRTQAQMEMMKQREEHQAELLRVKQEMQDKALAQQKELAEERL